MESKAKQPKTIYIIRHGETDFNTDPVPRVRGRCPVPLNDIGKRHANQAGEFLKTEKVTKIYHSPVQRAKETAEIIHGHFPDVPLVEEALINDISWGDWEGKTYEEAFGDKTGGLFKTDPSKLLVPNGESFYSVLDRLRKFFWKIYNSNEDNIVIVSHGAVINILSCMIASAPLSKYYTFHMSPCGISKVLMKSVDNIVIKYWNTSFYLK